MARFVCQQFSPDELLLGTLTGVKVADEVVIALPDRQQVTLPEAFARSSRRRLQ
jgi:hypothetical protein